MPLFKQEKLQKNESFSAPNSERMSFLGKLENSNHTGTDDDDGEVSSVSIAGRTKPAAESSLQGAFSIEPFNPAKMKWSRWVDRLEMAFQLFEISESRKLALLLHYMGPESYDVVADALAPAKPLSRSFGEIVKLLENHYSPNAPEIKEVFRFMSRKQGDARPFETAEEFLAALRKLAEGCNFGTYLEKALRNQFVFGLKNKSLQSKLLEIHGLTLAKAREIVSQGSGLKTAVREVPSPAKISRSFQEVLEATEEHISDDQEFLGYTEDSQPYVSPVRVKKDTSSRSNNNRTSEMSVVYASPITMDIDEDHQQVVNRQPRVLLEDIGQFNSPWEHNHTKRRFLENLNITADNIAQILESCPASQDVLRKINDRIPIEKTDKNLLCRTICNALMGAEVRQGLTVKLHDKIALAKAIIEAYPVLRCHDPERPPESEWFWENNGEEKGGHTGYIQHWVRNTMSKSAKTDTSRKRRAPVHHPGLEVLVQELHALLEEPENRDRIFSLMTETFPLRQEMRFRKKINVELAAQFPHLLQHGGEMLDHEFNLMFPDRKTIRTFESIIPFCMMLEGNFPAIECPGILSILKVMCTLSNTFISNIAKRNDPLGLHPIEDYLSILVRWRQPDQDLDYVLANLEVPPYIFVDNQAFGSGDFHAIIEGTAFNCGDDFCRAFDLVLKAYKVFAYTCDVRAKKVVSFFDISVYNLYKFSRMVTVNSLCDRMKAATATA